jgi:glutamate/tyrosine decarboxylase-like PLP-dependent enzyme
MKTGSTKADLALTTDERNQLWALTSQYVERYFAAVHSLPVSPDLDPREVRNFLAQFDFETALSPHEAVQVAVEGLTRWQVHTPHPRYFGLFNPAPTAMGVAADTLVAGFNPQMAAWSHNPFAAEVELHVIRALGTRFGYLAAETDGTFCSGGMEANHTALLTALVSRFPEFLDNGVRTLPAQPVLYVSAESHHSFLKAARLTGLGATALREIAVDSKLCMRPEALLSAIAADLDAGHIPFFVAGTAGTTNAGAIDPLPQLAEIALEHGMWFHADAAWGGAAALVPELRPVLAGIEQADSITFDAHKWLSTPMGAGVYLTRDRTILTRTFRIASAYMPKDASSLDVVDPHQHSMQWSRRFIGLKLFLSLLVAGWSGYEQAIRHQTAMGNLLRTRLAEAGWEIVNDTPLPVVCFAADGREREIAARVVESGAAWISPTVVNGRTVLRACITNYRTHEEDVEALIDVLAQAREQRLLR